MSFLANLPPAVLETILTRLAALFLTGANGDTTAARHAAAQMLAAYHPETFAELTLAANIIAFSFQALEALSQSAGPDISLTRILRLRGSAVSLSRESAKAERRLSELQKARQQPAPAQEAEIQPVPAQPEPQPEKALTTAQAPAKAEEERQREARIAASIQKAEARFAPPSNAAPHRGDLALADVIESRA